MITLRLYGELGEKFGKVHRYATTSTAQTLRLLFANYPELKTKLLVDKDTKYKIAVDTDVQGTNEYLDPINNKTIRITPVIMGAGSDDAKIVGGVILVAAAIWLTGGLGGTAASGFEAGTAGAYVAGIGMNIGMALIYGGISGLLYSPPKDPVGNPSRSFDGPLNTARQGVCVPIGYGMCLVGSATISAGIINN